MKHLVKLWLLMLPFGVALGVLEAQVNTASITGFVADHAGASIPGTQIKAENTATGLAYSAVSATNGAYTLSLLPPGTYQIIAQASGFTKFVVQSFGPLTIGQAARLDITLQVGALTQSVSVTAKTPLVDAENGTMGSVVNRTSIESLPLNGRDPYGLMSLVANVNFTGSTFLDYSGFNTNTVSINGGQSGSNEFLIDGAPTNSLQENEPVISPNTSMVEEFRILTNSPQAEYGPTGGGVISMVTRSGTNQLHGNAYEFVRNDAFDANTWANNRLGLGKPVLRYNQFGGSLGGPIVIPKLYHGENKTFFFANYETTLDNTSATNLTQVPTPAELGGDFSHTFIKDPTTKQIVPVQLYDPQTTRPNPNGTGYIRDLFPGARIPSTQLDPVALNASQYYPAPNRAPSDITGANNYSSTPAVPKTVHEFLGRVDHQFTESNRLFLRDIIIWENATGNPPEFSEANVGDPQYASSTSQNWQFVAGDTDTLSSTTINEFRFSMIREALRSSVPSYGLGLPQKLGLPADYPGFLFPQFNISGMSGIGNRPDKLANRSQTTGVLSDTLTKVWGAHSLKFGVDLRHEYNNNFQPGAISGSFSFGSAQSGNPQNPEATGFGYASFLLGAVGSGSLTSPYTPANAVHYYAGFVAG